MASTIKGSRKANFFVHGKPLLRSGELLGACGSTQTVAQHAWCERHD